MPGIDPTNLNKVTLHDRPVEPPGGRPPARPLLYVVAGIAAIFAVLFLLEAVGVR